MPLDTTKTKPPSTPIPVEFQGLARDLHRKAKAESEQAYTQIKRIDDLVYATAARGGARSITRHTIAAVTRIWDKLPRQYVLAEKNNSRGNDLHLTRIWLGTGAHRFDSWDADDWSLSFGVYLLEIKTTKYNGRPVGLETNVVSPVLIDRHAIGRWFQRTGSRDLDRLFADILMILKDPTRREAPWPCPSGSWWGEVVPTRMKHRGSDEWGDVKNVWAIRTFWE